MINNISLKLCLLFTIAVLTRAQNCRTPDNRNGICVPLHSCNSLDQMLSKNTLYQEELMFLRASKCSSGDNEVCCADTTVTSIPSERGTTTTERTISTTQTTTPTTSPTSVLATMFSRLSPIPRISVRKCTEYKEFTYDKFYYDSVFDIRPIKRSRSNCASTAMALILGGEPAKRREFPHMALIGYQGENIIHWDCGGTLISEEFVLSAAHCSTHPQFGSVKFVRLGEHILGRTDDASSKDFNIKTIISHPEYLSQSHYNDIILFKLDGIVKFDGAIRPACLPEQNNVPTKAIASGWGNVEWAGSKSNVLLKVELEIFSQDECSASYAHQSNRIDLRNGIVEETMICAGSQNEIKDTCQGDSGGPLQVFHEKHYCTYTVVGVTSFGAGCGFAPGVYTRVFSYLDWIESIVWPNE